jgi:capsular polysaccharide biosynthesis protein
LDFWDLTKLLVRRWQVALPLLLLSAVATVLTVDRVRPDYVATAYVQLVPPVLKSETPDAPKPDQRNPWLGLGLQTLGNAAIVTVLDQTVVDHLKATGYSDTFTVTMGTTTPLVTIDVVGRSERQARDTAEQLVQKFTQSVASLQTAYGVTSADSITARRLDLGTNIKVSDSNVKRALVAVAGAGLLFTAASTVGLDVWLRRRGRRRRDPAPVPAPVAAQAWSSAMDSTAVVPTMPNGTDRVKADSRRMADPAHVPAREQPTAKVPPTSEVLGGGSTGKDSGRSALTVEYQSAGQPPPAGQPQANHQAARAVEAAERESEVNLDDLAADATVVLPLSALPAKMRRLDRNGDKRRRP